MQRVQFGGNFRFQYDPKAIYNGNSPKKPGEITQALFDLAGPYGLDSTSRAWNQFETMGLTQLSTTGTQDEAFAKMLKTKGFTLSQNGAGTKVTAPAVVWQALIPGFVVKKATPAASEAQTATTTA